MKKSVEKRTVLNVLSAVAVALMMNISMLNAQTQPEYLYNTQMNGEQVISKTVCKLNKDRHELHLKHTYEYNSDNTLKARKTSYWNKETRQWEKSHKLEYNYDGLNNIYTLEYSRWDTEHANYFPAEEKAVYQLSDLQHMGAYYPGNN